MTAEQQKTADFLKEAFCIDGTSTFVKELTIDGRLAIMYELTDSKRGTFYITISR